MRCGVPELVDLIVNRRVLLYVGIRRWEIGFGLVVVVIRDEILDCYIFNNLNEVKQFTEEWIEIYNNERPHDSLNDMTPVEFRNAA